jgi:hypothetical protein
MGADPSASGGAGRRPSAILEQQETTRLPELLPLRQYADQTERDRSAYVKTLEG